MEAIRIVIACVVAAIVYGIVHDEITAHLCVEYFTVAHPNFFPTTSPFILGAVWGIAATWWIALLIGLILAHVSKHGDLPRLNASFVIKRILIVFAAAGICATLAGMITYQIAISHHFDLPDRRVPPSKHAIFFAVWAAHLTSYFVCITGGLIAVLKLWHTRLGMKSNKART